jgi:hypothetical protein
LAFLFLKALALVLALCRKSPTFGGQSFTARHDCTVEDYSKLLGRRDFLSSIASDTSIWHMTVR